MYNKCASIHKQCVGLQGNWVQFRTPWGSHRGIIDRVSTDRVLVRVPSQYAPSLAKAMIDKEKDDVKRLDLTLASLGYGGYGGYGAPGGYGGYGVRPGRFGGWWGGGWWWWWLAFTAIFALAAFWW